MSAGQAWASMPKWARIIIRVMLTGLVAYIVAWPVTGFIYWGTTEVKYGNRSLSALNLVGTVIALLFDTLAYPWVSGCAVKSYGCQFNYERVLFAIPIIFVVLLACQFRVFRRLLKNDAGPPPPPWHW
jgi:hypothetical protein